MILVTSAVAAFIGTALSLGILTDHLPIIALAMLFGGACYPLYALGVGLMSESLAPDELLTGNGYANIAYNVGAIAGPVAAGATIAIFCSRGLIAFLSVTVFLVPHVLLATSQIACLRPGCGPTPS